MSEGSRENYRWECRQNRRGVRVSSNGAEKELNLTSIRPQSEPGRYCLLSPRTCYCPCRAPFPDFCPSPLSARMNDPYGGYSHTPYGVPPPAGGGGGGYGQAPLPYQQQQQQQQRVKYPGFGPGGPGPGQGPAGMGGGGMAPVYALQGPGGVPRDSLPPQFDVVFTQGKMVSAVYRSD